VAGVAGTVSAVKSANDQASATKQSQKLAEATAEQQTKAYNKANANSPDIAAEQAANQQAALSGTNSTFLTGSGGIDTSSLNLGKSTLLGG
jgi:hypothetical protein